MVLMTAPNNNNNNNNNNKMHIIDNALSEVESNKCTSVGNTKESPDSKRTLSKVTLNKEIPFVLFNSRENLGDIEKFKELPYELQDMIASYIEEGYNIKCYNYNWYHIIDDLGHLMEWDTVISLLNKHLTRRYVKVIKNCGWTVVEKFITSDDRLWIGWNGRYEIKDGYQRYYLKDNGVDSKEITRFIVDKINDYLYSDIYDPSIMYVINKFLLDTYTCREFCFDDLISDVPDCDDDYDTYFYSEEEDDDEPPRSWYNGWDSD